MQITSVYTCPYDAYYVLYADAKNEGTTAYYSLKNIDSYTSPSKDVPLILGTQIASSGVFQAFYFKAGTKLYPKFSTGTYYLESIFKCN